MREGTVLVTGGVGYIGSHTVVELYSAGYRPIIADNLSNSSPVILEGISKIVGEKPIFERVDCANQKEVEALFINYPNIEYVIHFAAYKAVGESVEKPLLYYRNNLLSLINVLEQLEKRGRGSLIFSSSCTVYGNPDPKDLPIDESAPLRPASSPYGATKQMCEEILKDCAEAPHSKLNAISLRYFNPIGAHPSALIGELPQGEPQNLMPIVTQTATGERERVMVFGDDYNTPDGSCIRDYLAVTDLAKAHLAALKSLESAEERGSIQYFNLGTGRGLSVFEVLNSFMEANSIEIPYTVAPRRAGDVEQVWANPAKANRELKWSADTPLPEIMRSAYRWESRLKELPLKEG
ncbi:MAG: UDP-glucose 4-epimerase GalE [Bacteroidales bacterium]